MTVPLLKKKISYKLINFLILVIFFCGLGCSERKPLPLSAALTAEEKLDLEYFLRFLVFEQFGAFVLFGSKPLCIMDVPDADPIVMEATYQKWLASTPEKDRILFEQQLDKCRDSGSVIEMDLDRNLYDGWRALEKVMRMFPMKEYIIGVNREHERGDRGLILAHIQKTARVLAENYSIFKEAVGMDFQPLQAVLELKDPHSEFWKRLLKVDNHVAKGLLCGFGLKNSLAGNLHFKQYQAGAGVDKQMVHDLKNTALQPSTRSVEFGRGSPSNFTIPVFGAVEGDDFVEKYKKEKHAIEKVYHGQDFIEVTLQRLIGDK